MAAKSRVGIPDKPITFSGTGVSDDLESKGANTGADGRFTVEGEALDEVWCMGNSGSLCW